MNSKWYKDIPVSINNAFGDPLTEIQIEDTIAKINSLKNHAAPYNIITKAVINDEIYSKLKDVEKTDNFVVMYSLTGLDEGGYSFQERLETIELLNKLFGKVIILVRPIIQGRNDHYKNLEKIVKVAKNTSGRLITGAIHDEFKRKNVKTEVRDHLVEICEKNSIKYFHKSSCAAADITNSRCWMHDLQKPVNLDVVERLGYQFNLIDDRICLKYATVGDLNFIRMITKSYILTENVLSGYNLLSISNDDYKYEVSSSWYSWSNNTACEINCDYCIIHSIDYLDKECQIGVKPSDIEAKSQKAFKMSSEYTEMLKKGKFISQSIRKQLGYNDVRNTQICKANAYL
ncbi:hypothetical protein [Paenibacillus zanthoxyli]|uniref:hypothetical protein n=1 Tax=Paenibacillus zanthoxyli TaxID=369399 RepID=UPI00046F57D8|nr:hypothetical protein [Paenibacillus zanthoxyli]